MPPFPFNSPKMSDKLPEVAGGCIGIVYTLTYRAIIILAALKYLNTK